MTTKQIKHEKKKTKVNRKKRHDRNKIKENLFT